MPEGPEIRRAADRVQRAVAGKVAERVEFLFPDLQCYGPQLEGRVVTHVETRGKAMLTHFDCGLSVYSHNQLYGRWYVQRAGTFPRTGRSLRFAVHNETHSALLYSASEIQVLETGRVDEHPFLAKLGPDLLAPTLDEKRLRAQIADPRFARRPLHALLLDQAFVAGVGNYLRSEILFQAKLHPLRRPKELSATERRRLARAVLTIGRRAYETGGITNDPRRAKRLMKEGLRRGQARHHVFTRTNRPCWTCGTRVQRKDWGQRKLFFCPRCQPEVADT
ncbi:MAG: endonuclease VIII [Myxococcota bacterium]